MERFLLVALLTGGCDSVLTNITSHPDLSVDDFSSDLSMLPDLFTCGSRRDTGVESKSVVSAMTVPQSRNDFALDLNLDGEPDNALGNLLGALLALGSDSQPPLTAAVQNGSDLVLIDLAASSFTGDPCAATQVLAASPRPKPDFSGGGSFAVASSPSPAAFPGAIGASGFSTSDAAEPISLPILVPLGTALVPVVLVDAHLTFTLSPDGTPLSGQINGAVRQGDVTNVLIPSFAKQLNDQVVANPTGSVQLLQIFDTGCTSANGLNFDGTAAAANDGKIATCEVSENGIVKNVTLPDVQLFDGSGNFAPNPANTNKDSFSMGLGFTAVGATF